MNERANGIVTMTSDFGTVDGYVGAMKGALLGVFPRATIVDVTHQIPARDVTEAAFQLATVWPAFPAGTTHVIAVDSVAAASYRPIAVAIGGQYFVTLDNGVLTLVIANLSPLDAVELDREDLFRSSASGTFPARDVLCPVAGAVASGLASFTELGSRTQVESLLRLPWSPVIDKPGEVEATIVSVDRFGNCRTLITRNRLPGDVSRVLVRCGDVTVRGVHQSYRDVKVGRTLALFGSHGGLEIAVRGGSAAEAWELHRGDVVSVTGDFEESP